MWAFLSLCLVWSAHAVVLTTEERRFAGGIALLAKSPQALEQLQEELAYHGNDDIRESLAGYSPSTTADVRRQSLDSDSPATTQGKDFKIPFYPGNSTVFSPLKSKTFRVVPKQVCDLPRLVREHPQYCRPDVARPRNRNILHPHPHIVRPNA